MGTDGLSDHIVPASKAATTVLVVEDYGDLREIICRLLVLEGFDVHAASDGASAWRLLSSGRYDAMVCDLRLPGINGHDLICRVRQQYPAIAIVAMSGLLPDDPLHDGLESLCDEVLAKPLPSFRVLIAALRKAVSRRRLNG